MLRVALAAPESPESAAVPNVVDPTEKLTVPPGVSPFELFTVATSAVVPAVVTASGVAVTEMVGLTLPVCQPVMNV